MSETLNMAAGHESLARYLGAIRSVQVAPARWIGRCRGCGKTARIEGRSAWTTTDHCAVIASDGTVYSTRVHNSDELVVKRCACGGRCVMLHKVVEGVKKSKHTCGARCTNATGPNCDCRCRGANHGSNC